MSKSRQELTISEDFYREGTEFERTSKIYARRFVPAAPPALEILDVGCGTGVNARHLAARGHSVFGIDLAPTAVRQFCLAGFKGTVADVTEGIPAADGQYDLIFASEVIEHLADTESFLKELNRVTKPGGRLILTTPNSAFWVYRIFAVLGSTVTDVQHPGHVRFFSKTSLSDRIAAAGYEVEAVAARHIYLIVSGAMANRSSAFLEKVGFQREMRFRTSHPFWHLSCFSDRASGLWADTFIVSGLKPRHAEP